MSSTAPSKFEVWARTLPRHEGQWDKLYAAHWDHGPYELPSNRIIANIPLDSLAAATNGRLYVFPQYEYLKDRIEAFRDRHVNRLRMLIRYRSTLVPAVIIMGTPGIGKSWFLQYMAFLEIRLGHPFVLFAGGEYFVFSKAGVYVTMKFSPPAEVDAELWNMLLLVDVNASTTPANVLCKTPMFIVQASSLQREEYKWEKHRPYSVIFVMEPHDRNSLRKALSLDRCKHTDSEVIQAISDFGPNIQLIKTGLKDPKDAIAKLKAAMHGLSPQMIIGRQGNSETTHLLIRGRRLKQSTPEEASYTGSDPSVHSIANQLVCRLLTAEFVPQQTEEMRYMIRHFMFLPQRDFSAVWLFEAWAHQEVAGGRTLRLTPMLRDGRQLRNRGVNNADVLSIDVQSLELEFFESQSTVQSTSSQGKYYIAGATNNLTFDSFFRMRNYGIGLQMTTSGTHSFNETGLAALQSRIRDCQERLFVFVIPPGREFTCAVPSEMYMNLFKFYTYETDLKDVALSDFFSRGYPREENDDIDIGPEDNATVVDLSETN